MCLIKDEKARVWIALTRDYMVGSEMKRTAAAAVRG
jgi:hypothetical protein